MNRATVAPTMFEKIWATPRVCPKTLDTPAILYVDMHFTHEVTSPVAFATLAVRRPDRTLATLDYSTPTRPLPRPDPSRGAPDAAALQADPLLDNCRREHQHRNFEGRQGLGARTSLANRLNAAAGGVNGVISDPRKML